MIEMWKQIEGANGYEVSSLGNVRSKRKSLSPFPAKGTGYLQVDIAGKRRSVHRLVAEAFCDGFFPGAVVNHVDGVRTNNRSSNLEWVTQAENNAHSYRIGRAGSCKGRFSGDHPTSKPVVSVDRVTGERAVYASASDAARDGFDSGCISRCCRGLIRFHRGREWSFA